MKLTRFLHNLTNKFGKASFCTALVLAVLLTGCSAESGLPSDSSPEAPSASADISESYAPKDEKKQQEDDSEPAAEAYSEKETLSDKLPSAPTSEKPVNETARNKPAAPSSETDTTFPAKPSRPAAPAPAPKPPKPQIPQKPSASQAEKVLEIVNKERAKKGAAPLSFDADLNAAANVRVKEIQISFSHTRPNGESCFTVCNKAYGENIATGYPNAEAVMNGWMKSEGHRKNILKPKYKTIGIAYENGYWVQLFGF